MSSSPSSSLLPTKPMDQTILSSLVSSSSNIITALSTIMSMENELQVNQIRRLAQIRGMKGLDSRWSRGIPSVLLAQISSCLTDNESLLPMMICNQWRLSCQSNEGSMGLIWSRIRQRAISYSNICSGRFGIRALESSYHRLSTFESMTQTYPARDDIQSPSVMRSDGRLVMMLQVSIADTYPSLIPTTPLICRVCCVGCDVGTVLENK
jgi:hypothetical protein